MLQVRYISVVCGRWFWLVIQCNSVLFSEVCWHEISVFSCRCLRESWLLSCTDETRPSLPTTALTIQCWLLALLLCVLCGRLIFGRRTSPALRPICGRQ